MENLLSILEHLLFGNGDLLPTILIGCGRLGKAVSRFITTDTNGYKLIAAFDNAPDEVGKEINGIRILHIDELEAFCAEHHRGGVCSVCPAAAQRRSAAVWWLWASRASGTSPTTICLSPTPTWWWRTSTSATA